MGAAQRDASGQDLLPTNNDSGASWSYGSLTISNIYHVSSDGVHFVRCVSWRTDLFWFAGAMVLETAGTTRTPYGVMSNGTPAVAVGRYGTIRSLPAVVDQWKIGSESDGSQYLKDRPLWPWVSSGSHHL